MLFLPEIIKRVITYDPHEPLKTIAQVATIASAFLALLTFILSRTLPWLRAQINRRTLEKGVELYAPGDIKRSVEYYIQPLCQDVDPSGAEEPRALIGVKNKLFSILDDVLEHSEENRYLILLADSGMGKTSALMNYYVRNVHRFRKAFQIKIIPLGIQNPDEHISKVEGKRSTVLLLDAFDEDARAVRDHRERLRVLLNLTIEFRAVLITCRTQFFPSDEEIPIETATLKISSRAAGEPAHYIFRKLYLTPFSPEQAKAYLQRRYPLLSLRILRRIKIRNMAAKIPHLASRPMLLAYIDDIVGPNQTIHYAYQLYEEMVKGWLVREEGFVKARDNLRKFCEILAVDLYLNRAARGTESVPRGELTKLARIWEFPIDDQKLADWKLSTRSLLNRDALGNYKFAHRSIMEYLFIKRFMDGEERCLQVIWTDQMQEFFWEMLENYVVKKGKLPFCDEENVHYSLDFSKSGTTFLTNLTRFGLSLLRTPAIAKQRFDSIIKTAIALSALILDPDYTRELSLILNSIPEGHNYTLKPIVIYQNGAISSISEVRGLLRYNPATDRGLFGAHIPDVDSEDYQEALIRLQRVVHRGDGTQPDRFYIVMPIKQRGEYVGMLTAESDRSNAFIGSRQVLLIEILRLMGKYMRYGR